MTAPVVPAVVQRLRVLVACLLLVALAFSQSPGQLTADTKLDLAVAPLRFLGRALHLWDPEGAFGQLQNQAYGYLFPMGPFFALGELVDAPGWAVQRLWLSLVLVTALLGARALARELGIGTPTTQLLAGVAYALSPRVLTVGGPISIEAWPLAVLPWVIVPLVRGARGGSVRRAAALSGVAVLCIGGVNAAATLAVLPLAGLFLLTRLGSPRGRRLAAWWALAVPLAALWWALPLVLLGRYSLPFLDYIETAAVTTSTTSLVEVLRGTSHWLAYVAIGDGPWWRAGWELVSSPLLIVATALVAGLGLAGLLRRDVPERVFLLSGVLLGTLLVTAGHVGSLPGWLEPPLAGPLRELLDGPLAPFRNVHKFDAVLRLPLVLGLAHLASSVRWQRSERVPEVLRPVASRPVAALAVVGLLVGATPLLTGSLAPRGSFTAFPEAWPAVASWLEESAPEGRALVVPGASFGEYVWGRPLDEPLQPLAGSPWAVRNAVPLGTEGNTRLLDGVEELLESGRGSAGLAPLLRRAGVSHVVVRNDLDWLSAGASLPYLASRALLESPGVEPVQRFKNRDERIPPLEVFAVDDPADRVATYPADSLVRLSGGPESLLEVAEGAPDLLAGRPVVLAGEEAPEAAVAVVTDGSRRREVDFGRTRGGSSATLAADDPLRLDRPAADLVVVPGVEHRTTAVYEGVRAVRASSSASDPGSLSPADRSRQPGSAVDGNRATAWLPQDGPVDGEWLELVLDAPTQVGSVTLSPLLEALPTRTGDGPGDGPGDLRATLRVTTDAGSSDVVVDDTTGTVSVDLPPGPTERVRVTASRLGSGLLRAGLAEVTVPGVDVRRVLASPADAAQAPDVPVAVVLSRTGDGRSSCVPVPTGGFCTEGLRQVGEEAGPLERAFATTTSTDVVLRASARPLPGPELDDLLASGRGGPLQVRVLPDDPDALPAPPLAGPAMAFDRRPDTAWAVPAAGARLELSWAEPRTLSRLRLDLEEAPGDGPAAVGLTAFLDGAPLPTPSPEVFFDEDGVGTARGVTADRVVLTFPEADDVLRVTRLRLDGISDLVRAALPFDGDAVTVPCGEGPSVVLDGRVVQTSVDSTYGALERLEQVDLQPCDVGALPLPAGDHRLTGLGTPAFQVDGVVLEDVRLDAAVPAGAREVDEVQRWDEVERRLTVSAGAATYLAVKENANDGWAATLDGRPLDPQRLDGWQQGWLLPAGAAGTVELVYVPDRGFRLGLLGGLAAAGCLVALAAVRPRRRPVLPPAPAPRGGRGAATVGALAVAVLGGPAGLLAVGAGLAARLRGWSVPLALVATVLAGLLVALRPWPQTSAGADSAVPQLLVLLALGAAAAALLRPRAPRDPSVDEL